MHLKHGIQLGYCTNIHRGEGWAETFAALRDYTLRVRDRVAAGEPYGIGLRLGNAAAGELSDPAALAEFRRWLDAENCYVFTINGFPYGKFHGTRVKEQVYAPDWSTPERLAYTIRLFDLLDALLPPGMEGSVSTLPGSFKEFVAADPDRAEAIYANLHACAAHVAALAEKSGRDLHLGLEPEPLGWFETTAETVAFFAEMAQRFPGDDRIARHLGVNYDTCHLAVEFEEPGAALGALRDAGIRMSKLHLSSALRLQPTAEALARLRDFQEDTYLHQVVMRREGGDLRRFRDLPPALDFAAAAAAEPAQIGDEWRVHFHIPLHAQPAAPFGDTQAHLLGVLDALTADPSLCRHLEMETYTWEVLPNDLRANNVVDQLEREYRWTLGQLDARGLR
ncbi:MAG: metabolite traffic protein EboE [Verrucomicrobiales bacterium]